MPYRFILAVLVAASMLLGGRSAVAEARLPSDLQGIAIDDNVGATLPHNVQLTDDHGQARTLGDFLKDDKPLVLVFAYYQCPMLCSVVLHHLDAEMQGLAWTAGKDFRVLTVSFDKRDGFDRAAEARTRYVGEYEREVAPDGWTFAVGQETEIRRLADSVGFHYKWDESTQQFAHAAGVFVVTPDGRLSRTLYGISYTPVDMRVALTEASEGKLGSAIDKVILFCFHYDPAKGNYVVGSARLMRIGAAVAVAALLLWLRTLWRSESERKHPRPAKALP